MEAEREKSKPEEGDTFMVTYVSLMILLLTFMILLVTLAQFKEPRFRKAIGSFRGALAFLPYTGGNEVFLEGSRGFLPAEILRKGSGQNISSLGGAGGEGPTLQGGCGFLPAEVLKGLEGSEVSEAAVGALRRASELERFEGLDVSEVDGGLRIRIADKLMFERGKADLKSEILPILDLVATAVIAKPTDVIVVGHTCDLPISTRQFPSNWDLSLARAISVVHYLESRLVPPELLFPYGLADEMPIVENDSEENRAKNRRVEIYLVSRSAKGEVDHGRN